MKMRRKEKGKGAKEIGYEQYYVGWPDVQIYDRKFFDAFHNNLF